MTTGLRIELYLPPAPYRARRSWLTRLFTLPWRPWVATRWITPQPVMSAYDAYRIGDRIVAGAHAYETIKRMFPVRRENMV